MKMRFLVMVCFCVFSSVSTAFAAEDDSQVYGEDASVHTELSTAQRLAILERQQAYFSQKKIPEKLQELQAQIAQLQGRIDELEHQNQVLSDQVKQQYQDLNQRLNNSHATEGAQSTEAIAEGVKPADKAKKLASNEQVLVAHSSSTAKTSESDATEKLEQAAYQKALTLLKKRDYVRAIPSFENFLSKYPRGSYTANAHFWLGEIYLLQGQPDSAVTEYQKVIAQFPDSDKVSMASLKLGFAYRDQGNAAKTQLQFQKVIKAYRGTPAAQLAAQELKH